MPLLPVEPQPHAEQLGTCGRARVTGQPCPDHPAVAERARYIKRAAPDAGRIVTVNRVWTADDGHTAVAYEWGDRGQCGSACPLDVFHRTYEPEPEAEPRLAVLDGRDALAFVIIRPADDDPDRVTVEAGSRGMSKAAAAYVLRTVADEFDEAALAEGDEPIPYTLTEEPPAGTPLTVEERAQAEARADAAEQTAHPAEAQQ
ncbi:hypothetical protein [Streptomyces sp. NBC_00199]|uniref:hypothetical protein n=1 Tax=Streptomyces sp. NBC_00199 TaxID=2975678 RepID=UPI00225189B6|nr:hypothetical protein [Streptomyces sp. NBC_00199]MCX5266066.1 hypothetical protein [Streptomyces sp. NBC_00199]